MRPKKYALIGMLVTSLTCHADELSIKQYPGSASPATTRQPTIQAGPDEGVLWALYHAGKIKLLRQQIQDLSKRYPNWRAPSDLLHALTGAGPSESAAPPGSTAAGQRSRTDVCSNLDKKWPQAAALLHTPQHERGMRGYRNLIAACKDPQNQEMTLKKAGEHLAYDDFKQLVEFASRYIAPSRLDAIEYEWLKNAYIQHPPENLATQKQAVQALHEPVARYRDADLANLIAWRYFDLQDYQQAEHWFAMTEHSGQGVSAGRLLALEKLGQSDRLLELYSSMAAPDAKTRAVAARVYRNKAWQSIDSGDFTTAQQHADSAERLVGEDFETLEIKAWIADRQQNHAQAAPLFESLYRQSPRREYAQAYLRHQREVDADVIDSKIIRYAGPLFDEYNKAQARNLYYRKQFLAAEALSPGLYPNLANIDSPAVDIGGYARYKSGDPGLSQLEMLKTPEITGSYTLADVHQFKFSVSRVDLDAGADEGLSHQLNDGVETEFSYRLDGWFSPYLRLGNTPTNGVISPALTFDAGFIQQTATGNWGLDIYSQPVRQSILSYTGVRNADNQAWGRVLRSGIKASGYYGFNDQWGASGAADIAMLNGENVKDNTAVAFSAGFARNFALPGFDYFGVGPSFMFEHYARNLSHFQPGHGGYFSPDQYYNVSFGVRFLTEEGKPFIIKGHAMAGFQSSQQNEAPWLPLTDPDLGSYSGSHSFGDALDLEAKGVWLLGPNIQLGGGFGIRHASNFEDFTGGLFIRYFFEDRKASYSSDIPASLFNGMQAY